MERGSIVRHRIIFVIAVIVLAAAAFAQQAPVPDITKASWIWSGPKPVAIGEWECYGRKTFKLSAKPAKAEVLITADNVYELFVNGTFVGEDGGFDAIYWGSLELYDITKLLTVGANVIAARAKSLGGSGGLLIAVRVEVDKDNVVRLHSGADWKAMLTYADGWNKADHDDGAWKSAVVLGGHGMAPWGAISYPGVVSPMTLSRLLLMDPDDDFNWPAGVVFVRDFVPLKEPEDFVVYVLGSRAYFEHDAATPAALGRQLWSLVPAKPDGKATLLCDAGSGVIGSPTVSYDGKTIYFSMVPDGGKFFHIYRIGADGSDLWAITDGPFHDYDPAELADGRIVFSSTRIGSRDEYHGNLASSLFAMNANGTGIEPLTYHIVADREPKVAADGSVVMIRADNFFERAKVETRIQQVRPDGTGGMVILGADREAIGFDPAFAAERNSAWLRQNGVGSPAPLPDGRVAAISNYGVVLSGVFDSGRSSFEKAVIGYVPYDIAPLPDGRLLCTLSGRNRIGVLDLESGKIARIYSQEKIHSVAYLGARPRPRVIASHIMPNAARRFDKTGFLLCQSVFTTKQTNADLSRIKAVRILEGRPFTLRSAKHRFAHLGVEGIELGTVPLAPDGSFYVEVPADRALAIQLVDAEGRSVINETSWLYVRPGERLSCVGCHNRRTAAPDKTVNPMAARFGPVRLTGDASPHRYRANNAANGGVLNLQFDRFREAGAITIYENDPRWGGSRGADVERFCGLLNSGEKGQRIAAARQLAILRDRKAAGPLASALKDASWEVRMNAALALAACGDRRTTPALLGALDDKKPFVRQAAYMALEHLTGSAIEFDAFDAERSQKGAASWRAYLDHNDWETIEKRLIDRLDNTDAAQVHLAVETLGHIGGPVGAAAMRDYLKEHHNENLRIAIAAMRALGSLQDAEAMAVLTEIFKDNMCRDPGKAADLHELGWQQKPVHLAAAAAEALGRIATPQAQDVLTEAFPKLLDFWQYTLWSGDHSWLMGCHSSVLHYRILEAFDSMETTVNRPGVLAALRAVPIDTDRALLYETDAYENLTARVVNRSGLADSVIQACLAILGDTDSEPADDLKAAVTASPPALSVLPHDPESRAAEIASVICLDIKYAAPIRRAFERYRAMEPSRKRSWVCFYLGRCLGKLRDGDSAQMLLSCLTDDATEASFGFEDQPNVFVYKAMTPFYRAAAADALGRIGDAKAVATLFDVVKDFDNALSVRHAAAGALALLCGPSDSMRLRILAADYPEVSVRRALLDAHEKASSRRIARAR